MRGFGVKDAERDGYVEWIEAAHAEGQIGEADRDLRVARARGAETRDELVTLTRDLRPVTTRPVAAGAPLPPMVRVRRGPSRRTGGVLLGVSIFLVLVGVGVAGIVALFALAVGPTTVGQAESGRATPVEVVDEGGLDARQLRAFLRAYPERFGTDEALQLVVADGRVTVSVPLPGDRPGAQMWAWDGSWAQLTGRTPVPEGVSTVDLRALDVRALARNVEVARSALGRDARVTSTVLSDAGSGPRVRVELVGRDTAGTLVTTPAGEVVRGVWS
ncbi:DUF1707 domain-containing protein [Nocardioides sp. J2M5]|uniref:DUF1707 SHOCT-like domain-containing protein n=1 Tax=Nocardioides palaemonis TaxID=2829810 RepID=UPI001BA9DBE8|nr:DUF1707 domain-containing protein [Nocardioides palaemonis]MBS2939003.1 DUF1707 domain-containing protein [Nocardioides palaemonis]